MLLKTPTVTIGIPTFNRASSTLPGALASAISQSYADIQIIVADNASWDKTAEVVTDQTDARVDYFKHPENITANDNFNFCLSKAKGEYFLLLHDDDVLEPDFVQKCVDAIDAHREPVGIVRTGVHIIDGRGNVVRTIENRSVGIDLGSFVNDWFEHKTSPYCCNTLINTQALRDIGGFQSPCKLFQDVQAHVEVAARMDTLNVSQALASFRRHDSNLGSAARIKDWCIDSRYLLNTICTLLPGQATELKTRGNNFFARNNFGRISSVRSLAVRLYSYLYVTSVFGFSGSPISYALNQDIFPTLSEKYSRTRGNSGKRS